MAELGELSLWAALPLALLAAVAAFGGGWTGRADLARLGGRAAEAAALLQLVALAGLAYALITVELRFVYVAAVTGFDEPPLWRLAATWSAPEGGALVLALLITIVAAVSGRLGGTRQAAARTGAVASLAVIGLLMVLVRARPFAQPDAPALVGGALPFSLKDPAWQIELWAVYLAVAFGSLALAEVVGGQLVDARGSDGVGRGAMRLAGAALGLAILGAAWRIYAGTGRLFDVAGLASLAVYLPAWLLALSCLHAPSGPVAPVWAARWTRILGVAFFPAVVAAGAAVVGAGGGVPSAFLSASGLAIGVLAGAMAGMAHASASLSRKLVPLPGFGPWAIAGSAFGLGMAAIVVVWSLFKGPGWSMVAWPLVWVGIAGAVAWSVARPAVGKGWLRLALALAAGAAAAAVGYVLVGNDPLFAVACAVVGASAVGAAVEQVRLRAARRAGWQDAPASVKGALAVRAGRRRASVVGHLGFALLLLGLSAEGLRVQDTRPLSPGQGFELTGRFGKTTRVTYLGLSRYQVGQLDKRVASFRLYREGASSQLATAALITDIAVGRVSREPTLVRAALGDLVVDIAGRVGDEAILCRLAYRPLASCVWLGGVLVVASFLVGGAWRWQR